MRHVDRISTLPDDVITNSILSLLPTRESVRTSALSTRWKHLYASVPILIFEKNESVDLTQPDPAAFAGFVSKVLNTVINKLSRVSELNIYLNGIRVSSSDIISWIETATSHSVQTLVVSGCKLGSVPIPRSLFTCQTLVSLSFDIEFVLRVPDLVCLPNLKNLWLKNFNFSDESDDESVKRLFSGCPVLESLMVFPYSDYFGRVFDVSVPSLKVLSLYLSDMADIELSINCPNLEELTCHSYAMRGYSGNVLGSLKKCEIEAGPTEDQQLEQGKLIELVRQVCKVQFLSLAGDSMQALLVSSASIPTFENLIHLTLESSVPNGWQLLPSILDCSPRLKTLVFPNGFLDIDDYFGTTFLPPEHVPVCLSFHLKSIRLDKFIGEEVEYKWVEYFLTSALVLEKMEICLKSSEGSEEENDPIVEGEGEGEGEGDGQVGGQGQRQGQEEEEGDFDPDLERNFEIGKRLLNFQRSSEVCQLLLVFSDC